MKSHALGKFVASISISCSAEKLGSTLMGHPREYIILPSANRTLDIYCGFTIFLMAFSTHSFRTYHKHNRTWAYGQTFLC